MRAAIIADVLVRPPFNHEVKVLPLQENLKFEHILLDKVDLVIFSKLTIDCSFMFNILHQKGIPIVLDICDNVLLPAFKFYSNYQRAFPYCSGVTTTVAPLKRLLAANTKKPVWLIPDVQEGDRVPPSEVMLDKKELNVLWFGQSYHLNNLINSLEEFKSFNFVINLTIITLFGDAESEKKFYDQMQSKISGSLKIKTIEWSLDKQLSELKKSDFTIIPSEDTEFNHMKSPNRLMTSLWNGKPVVAYPLDSYLEFKDEAILHLSIAEGIKELLVINNQELIDRITRAQVKIEERYSPFVIAKLWEKCFEEIIGLIRLNLGCGDKILPGYTNVDLVQERANKKPDIICDVRKLKVFRDDYADEILSVHVIEHFYYWEASDLIKEWVRVLKPGGKMIIECPNILTACEEVLKNPIEAVKPGQTGQRTMWVFYGDPSWKDPLMCHKWLYSPQSLAELMAQCGLVNIQQEPAQFKLREPRDMRLVGYKTSKINSPIKRTKVQSFGLISLLKSAWGNNRKL